MVASLKCDRCRREILEGYYSWFEANGAAFHPTCLQALDRCAGCGLPIVSPKEDAVRCGADPYHLSCAQTLPECAACREKIGQVVTVATCPLRGAISLHPACACDRVRRCECCGCIRIRTGVKASKNTTCTRCHATAVLTQAQLERLFERVVLETGFKDAAKQVDQLSVGFLEEDEDEEEEVQQRRVSTEGRCISITVTRVRDGKIEHSLTCEIRVTRGMSSLRTSGTIAHELQHAVIKCRNLDDSKPPMTDPLDVEGTCEFANMMHMVRRAAREKKGEEEEAALIVRTMLFNRAVTYRDGFRKVASELLGAAFVGRLVRAYEDHDIPAAMALLGSL